MPMKIPPRLKQIDHVSPDTQGVPVFEIDENVTQIMSEGERFKT
jgi:hypothetical protein